MAEASISVSQDEFNCSVCLDILKDPVTIPCGHSFCMGCIKGYWNHPDQRGVCKCPLCKSSFAQRPVLAKNIILAEMLVRMRTPEKIPRRRRFQSRPHPHSYAAPGDVPCGLCMDRKQKAVHQCLTCLVAYCETHAKPHQESPAYNSHPLIKVSERPWKICHRSHPDKHALPCEIFCDDDQECLCLHCLDWGHKQHRLVSADEEITRKQAQIKAKMMEHQQKIKEREDELQKLRKAINTIKLSANSAVQSSERIFTELIGSIEKKRTAMTHMIRSQEKADLSRAADFFKQVSVEITMLKQKYAELEQFLKTEDHIHFLENAVKICPCPGSESLPKVSINTNSLYEKTEKFVLSLKQRVEQILQVDFDKMSSTVKQDRIIESEEPLIRQDFLKYTTQITLDINTAYNHLSLSDGNRQVTWSDEALPYPDLPQRFNFYNQVLGKECLSGPSYWEVEWAGKNGVYVAVTYVGIKRQWCTGDIILGHNALSWSLECSPSHCCFRHNEKTREITVPSSKRVGVYVNFKKGTLSFYSVSDTLRLLHREYIYFRQLVYPALWIGVRSNAKFCY
ncbi:tripartite motif-containing protein 16-like [Alosa pseudoharengus]|uniref:tripartite motif-containing protein 16-like n=1 Tax=Alosa pseudoharengus TaxID=34774 RepID=UPI003F895ADA